jgi:hypothetical protein
MLTRTSLALACLAMAAPAQAFMTTGPVGVKPLLHPSAASMARPLGAMPGRTTPRRGPARLQMKGSAPPGMDFMTFDTEGNPPAYISTPRAPRYSSQV